MENEECGVQSLEMRSVVKKKKQNKTKPKNNEKERTGNKTVTNMDDPASLTTSVARALKSARRPLKK